MRVITVVFRYLGDNLIRCLLLHVESLRIRKQGAYEIVHFSLIYTRTVFKEGLLTKKLLVWSRQVYFISI